MNFIKKEIQAKTIWLIDIGTYKIRSWICTIKNRDVELVGYGEKRQDEDYINMQEIKDLEWVAENIGQAILKAEKDWDIFVEDIILNIPTENLFFEFSKINHIREDHEKEITQSELYEILTLVESIALKKHYWNIKKNSWYKKNELKLLIGNISNISVDGKNSKKLIWLKAHEINISILNIFIPESSYDYMGYLSKAIWKNIIKIIPSEYAVTWLFKKKKDMVIIDLWNSHTSLILKKWWNVIWAKKISLWMNDLIKQIRNNYNLTKNDIIKSIDLDRFTIEKTEFLQIFKDILAISLEELLWDKVCPNDFFMLGGWANKFIKHFLSNTDFHDSNVKIVWKIHFIDPEIDFLDDKIKNNPDWIDSAKSNINIYAMIKTTLNFIKHDKNIIEKTMQKVISDLDN